MKTEFISLKEFKHLLEKHVFSFVIQHDMRSAYPSAPKQDLLKKFIKAQEIEATMIFPDAFNGGDEYMFALAEAQALALRSIVTYEINNIPDNYLEIKVFSLLDSKLQKFLINLSRVDWYKDYSKPNSNWVYGANSEQYVKEALITGGPEYRNWYNKFKETAKKEVVNA